MTKKNVIIAASLVVALVGGAYTTYQRAQVQKEKEYSEVMLANLDALTEDESSSMNYNIKTEYG